MQQELNFLNELVSKGGPQKLDYKNLDLTLKSLAQKLRFLPKSIVDEIANSVMKDSFGLDTLQGFAYKKPHGYAGDFEIIERIYNQHISSNGEHSRWDEYFHAQPAPKAVINRKAYCKKLLTKTAAKNNRASVLNVASGPVRDIYEFYQENPYTQLTVDCIDQDPNAIAFARERCKRHLNKMNFHNQNALRFKSEKTFDLVWSAGLFDYFNDATFVKALKHLASFAKAGGEVVIGNFCDSNPTQAYMDLFDWKLHHRSADKLISLALNAGFSLDAIKVGKEEEEVNLFLHIHV